MHKPLLLQVVLFFQSQPIAFCQDLKKALELSRQEFDCSFLDEDREEPDHSSSTGTGTVSWIGKARKAGTASLAGTYRQPGI